MELQINKYDFKYYVIINLNIRIEFNLKNLILLFYNKDEVLLFCEKYLIKIFFKYYVNNVGIVIGVLCELQF